MKNLAYFLLLCICIVGCKKESIPLRVSPIVFLDEIDVFNVDVVFINDLDGNLLTCIHINNETDYNIPDSINQLNGYHITFFKRQYAGLDEFNIFNTYTHLKTNKLISKSPTPIPPYNLKTVEFSLNIPPEELEYVVTQREIDWSSNGQNYRGHVHKDAEYAYLFVKKKNENHFRYIKSNIPQDDFIPVDVSNMNFLNDSITEIIVKEYMTSSINGIKDCSIDEVVPVSFNNSIEQKFYLLHQDELSFDSYFSYHNYIGDSIHSKIFQKGDMLKNYQPEPVWYKLLYSDFDKFQIIIPKPNCVAKMQWSNFYNIWWDIYGDFQSSLQLEMDLPDCISFIPITGEIKLKFMTIYEGSEFDNYEEFVRRKIDRKLPFYERNFCDSRDEEFYEEKIIIID